jgi:hypothetical protein
LKDGDQPLQKKGNGRAIMTAGWICETFGHLHLSDEQITNQAKLPEDQWLHITDAHWIIYPGKDIMMPGGTWRS